MQPTAGLIARLAYKPGWAFKLGGPLNRYLCVFARTPDSHHPNVDRVTQHMFEIPDLEHERAFCRWVFDCLLEAERHECGEFLSFDGFRPFYPNHQGDDPYALVERWEP